MEHIPQELESSSFPSLQLQLRCQANVAMPRKLALRAVLVTRSRNTRVREWQPCGTLVSLNGGCRLGALRQSPRL